MAALVQTYPQQPAPVAMLQTRPSSGSGLQSPSHQYPGTQPQRNNFQGRSASGGAAPAYRNSGPIKPYAFTSTPSLNSTSQWQQVGAPRPSPTSNRPAPRAPEPNRMAMGVGVTGSRDDSAIPQRRSISPAQRPQSSYMASTSSTQLSLAQATPVRAPPDRYRRPGLAQHGRSPSAQPSGSGMGSAGQLYTAPPIVPISPRSSMPPGSRPSTMSGSAVDDTQVYHPPSQDEKRLRRRSMHTLDSADYPNPLTPHLFKRPGDATRPTSAPNGAGKDISKAARFSPNLAHRDNMHNRNNSSESVASSRSSHSRPPVSTTALPAPSAMSCMNHYFLAFSRPAHSRAQLKTGITRCREHVANGEFLHQSSNRNTHSRPGSNHSNASHTSGQEQAKPMNTALRPSADAVRRAHNPSPLSRPATMASEEAVREVAVREVREAFAPKERPATPAPLPKAESPAAKHLAAINQKSKSKTSRLRRAFSFGSAAEFKKAAGPEPAAEDNAAEPAKLHKEPTADELYDAEQERIAKKQEAAGLGTSIYGPQIFAGSTDNLSISSTASSASIMIRKMGRGMKKGTRSLVGIFRPKSIVGEPSADAASPVETKTAPTAVSMVTVEAERERVNVNADPHEQPGGGTGFPRLERNSLDAPSLNSEREDSSETDSSAPRKSIVGGDRERAEVLAAVRKGILKRKSHRLSKEMSPVTNETHLDRNGSATDLPSVPGITESPNSSAPSTPNDEAMKRGDSVAIGNEDYFVTALRLRQDTRGGSPGTPASAAKRNATFSPRIVFYDTWPSGEYDRRGETATCNRLTPMLAQQIKEELNSFKMVRPSHLKCPSDGLGIKPLTMRRRWKSTRTRRSTPTSSNDHNHGQAARLASGGLWHMRPRPTAPTGLHRVMYRHACTFFFRASQEQSIVWCRGVFVLPLASSLLLTFSFCFLFYESSGLRAANSMLGEKGGGVEVEGWCSWRGVL